MRILLTRPVEDAERSAARIEALGHTAIRAPLIEIVGRDSQVRSLLYDAVIATSSHAVDLRAEHESRLMQLPIYVVGERTARAARTRGWTTIATVAEDSRALTVALLACDPGMTWLYLAGSPRSPALEQALELSGRRCTAAIVYEARPVASLPLAAALALRNGEIDAVLHYSARSAATFVDLVRRAGLEQEATKALHVAISEKAAAALRGFARTLRVAARPDEAGVLNELDRQTHA